MEVLQVQDEKEFLTQATAWLKNKTKANDLVFLPAGETPIKLYNYWENQRPTFLKQLKFQQVDDIIKGEQIGLFNLFFKNRLPSYFEQFLNLKDEPIEGSVAILGIGNNGHVAFHEPGIDLNMNYGCVLLNPETQQSLQLNSKTYGLTYGLGTFKKCKSILLLGSGQSKVKIIKSLINREKSYVVSHLLGVNDLTLLIHPDLNNLL